MKTNVNNLTTKAEDVKAHFQGHFRDFFSSYMEPKNGKGDEYQALCPLHDDSDPSFSFNNQTGQFYCHGCKASGDAFQFYGKLKGASSFPEIVKGIAGDFNILSTKTKKQTGSGRIVKTYDYVNADGALLYQAVRIEPKSFRQRQPDGKGGWIWDMKNVDRVLYRFPEVLQADQVIVVEGEKDADNVSSMGLVATTNVGGAEKWAFEYSKPLEGKDVVILPDNDEPGRKHAVKVARMIHGIAKSVTVIDLPGLPEKGDVSDWIQSGGTKEALQKLIDQGDAWMPETGVQDEDEADNEIKERFPRGPFPWGVLPVAIADSLKQLARSCATSSTSLPGAAMAIFSSLIGTVLSVAPKISWFEPLIFWFMDIRASGTGKTPAARALCWVLYQAQKKADDAYTQANMEYLMLSKKERKEKGIDVPPRPRGYFSTDLTLEGLREDLQGHGGQVIVLDELSSFISAQNQYKAKGNDREAWLCLHDGNPARVVRAGKSITIQKSRVSIFGGIQPRIWRESFTGEDGAIYQFDGTIFRFLPVYEGDGFHPLTAEAWSEKNRDTWERLLSNAMDWGNRKNEAGETHNLILSDNAREIFLDWANDLHTVKMDLPEQVRGFIPKLIGYALRFSGVLYLMDIFSRGEMPGKVLGPADIRKGIKVSEFYLGHIIEAMKALVSEDAPLPFEKTDRVVHLAKTLEGLRDQVDGGLLAIGFIWENFNKGCDEGLHVKSDRAMGTILRDCGLTETLKNQCLQSLHQRAMRGKTWRQWRHRKTNVSMGNLLKSWTMETMETMETIFLR
ncbi:MAG: hypothetical protein B6240_14730 [Desulfobacteraceae bacterium 4572_87]|nr:MAG: hypothetical protein B6240_14730 [Desulfobacteraceae bacterium 4572_87]